MRKHAKMHKLAGWGPGGGEGRSLARAHRCRRANKKVSMAPKIWVVSSVTGGESFCCDSDSSCLKSAIRRPPQRKLSSLSRCSPGPGRFFSPLGREVVGGYVAGADRFLYEGCAKSSAFEAGRKQAASASPARCLLLALQNLTQAPSLGCFIRASADSLSSAGVFLQLLFITTLPFPLAKSQRHPSFCTD